MRQKVKKIDYFQRLIDVTLVFSTWMISYFLKFEGGELFEWYLNYGGLLALISLIVFKNSNVYDSIRFSNISKEVATQLKANAFVFILFLVAAFFLTHQRVSRVHLILYFVLSSGFLILSKVIFRKLRNSVKQRILIIGKGKPAKEYVEKIKSYKNFEIIKWVESITELDITTLENEKLDDIVIGYDAKDADTAHKALEILSELIIPLVVLPDVSFSKLGYAVSDFKGQPLIYLNEPTAKTSGLILKRIFDFSATLIGVIFISPFLFIIALLVKFTSKGPILYHQTRMGVDGQEFKMWKFRSMVTGVENHGGWTVENDPRVTKIGKILRKTNLDELPQLWNVLMGDMSLVGPRPERPQYVTEFRKEIPGYMIRHKFKAGVTGWAQVNGWRGDTSIEERIKCDLWYIKNWSFWLDITILFMTFFKGNKNAY